MHSVSKFLTFFTTALFLYNAFAQWTTESSVNCQEPKKPGTDCPGATPSYRWYFNNQKSHCMQFKFRGCNGNGNNFASPSDCERCFQMLPTEQFRCFAIGEREQVPERQNCQTFNCAAPYVCRTAPWGSAQCCYEEDFKCPDGSEFYKADRWGYLAENCDDLNCPNGYRCVMGRVVARCCR